MNTTMVHSRTRPSTIFTGVIPSDAGFHAAHGILLIAAIHGILLIAAIKDRRLTAVPDEFWMEEALRAAHRALESGEVPVGAVVVCDGKIVGRGSNRNLTDSDPTAHAEIVALRQAGVARGNHRLEDCELFATIEPCAMCAGAMIHARLKRLVYGAEDVKAGAVRSVLEVLNHPRLNHQMEVRGGVLAGRCAEMLQSFFRSRR